MSERLVPDEWRDILPRQPWAWQPGELEAVPLPNPAAGAELVYGPAGGAWERIEYVHARFVTGVGGGSRIPHLVVLDGNANELYRATPPATPGGSTTNVLTWARGLGANSSLANTGMTIMLPDIILRPGWTIATVTSLIAGGDQWSLAAVTVTRFKDADPTLLAGVGKAGR